jgi:putative flippase GtrA
MTRQRLKAILTSSVLAQVVRYGLAGGITTAIYSAIYLALAWSVFPAGRAMMAVPFAFVAALIVGFVTHSRWSFAGHGTRDNTGLQHGKFLIVHGAGFALNLAFTWLLTARLGAPVWAPLIPTVTIIPVVSFLLLRQWVFASAR